MRTTLSLLATTILIGLAPPALAADSPRPLAAGDTLIGGQLGLVSAAGTSLEGKWAHLTAGHLVTDWLAVGGHVGASDSPFGGSWSGGVNATGFVELSPRFYFAPTLTVGVLRGSNAEQTTTVQHAGVRFGLLALVSEHLFARFDVGGADLVRVKTADGAGYSASADVNGGGFGVRLGFARGDITLGLRL